MKINEVSLINLLKNEVGYHFILLPTLGIFFFKIIDERIKTKNVSLGHSMWNMKIVDHTEDSSSGHWQEQGTWEGAAVCMSWQQE